MNLRLREGVIEILLDFGGFLSIPTGQYELIAALRSQILSDTIANAPIGPSDQDPLQHFSLKTTENYRLFLF